MDGDQEDKLIAGLARVEVKVDLMMKSLDNHLAHHNKYLIAALTALLGMVIAVILK